MCPESLCVALVLAMHVHVHSFSSTVTVTYLSIYLLDLDARFFSLSVYRLFHSSLLLLLLLQVIVNDSNAVCSDSDQIQICFFMSIALRCCCEDFGFLLSVLPFPSTGLPFCTSILLVVHSSFISALVEVRVRTFFGVALCSKFSRFDFCP